MQKAILKFRDYLGNDLISGISNGQGVTSHTNLNGANDFNGRGSWDRVDLLAPYDCVVKAISRADNTVLFESIGVVQVPAGYNECWFLCSHMLDKDFDKLGIEIGKTFKQGDPCYTEGNKNAYDLDMGNHIHMEQGIGRHDGNPSPYYRSNDTYTYEGKTYNTYYPHVTGYECPITDMFFLPYGVEKLDGISTVAKDYIWQYTDVEDTDQEQPKPSTGYAESYSMIYKGINVKVGKINKYDYGIRGSVDGNKYGTAYDHTTSNGFTDKDLINKGYKEVFASNGSTFYFYDNKAFAEGIENSKGIINQEYSLSCVSKFTECMAMGFPYEGGIVFDLQKSLQARNDLYGAVTAAFGIMKDGRLNNAGSEDNRGQCFTVRAGRTIWAEDDENYYLISFDAADGAGGLTGDQLYDLVVSVSSTMINAVCFDGGKSVFARVNGEYINENSSTVKNGLLLFAKEKDIDVNPDPEEPDESYQEEIEKLKAENAELIKMNEELHNRINSAIGILNGTIEIEEGEE